jgi:predicted RNA polymerase sigma factor
MGCQSIQEGGCRSRLGAGPSICSGNALARSVSLTLGHLRGPAAALSEIDQLADRLNGYHLWHATRAQLLTELGDRAAARAANERALGLTHNPAEQQLLRSRLVMSDLPEINQR